MAKNTKKSKTTAQKQQTTKQPDLKEKLSEYLKDIAENITGDPFVIAYGYILGTLLTDGDSEYQRIAYEHIDRCSQICDDSTLYEAMVGNGGNVKEVAFIRLADKFRHEAALRTL